jgi:hypothetical protein
MLGPACQYSHRRLPVSSELHSRCPRHRSVMQITEIFSLKSCATNPRFHPRGREKSNSISETRFSARVAGCTAHQSHLKAALNGARRGARRLAGHRRLLIGMAAWKTAALSAATGAVVGIEPVAPCPHLARVPSNPPRTNVPWSRKPICQHRLRVATETRPPSPRFLPPQHVLVGWLWPARRILVGLRPPLLRQRVARPSGVCGLAVGIVSSRVALDADGR